MSPNICHIFYLIIAIVFFNAKFIGNEYSMQFAFTWSRYVFRNSMFVKKNGLNRTKFDCFCVKSWALEENLCIIFVWPYGGWSPNPKHVRHYCVHFKRRTCQHTFTKTCSTKDIEIMMRNNTVQVYTR